MRGWPVAKTCSGILRLVSKREPDIDTFPRIRASFSLELACGVREHDEAAFGARDIDGGVHHEQQHFVEHARAAERAQRVEQRGHLPEPAGDRRRRRIALTERVVEQEDELSAGRSVRCGCDRRARGAAR